MVLKSELLAAVQGRKPARSAWDRGVQAYAVELCENLVEDSYVPDVLPDTWKEVRALLLNGADDDAGRGGYWDWYKFSMGGCSLVYDCDIVDRLCTPSERRRVLDRFGNVVCKPARHNTWLELQARALFQAACIVCALYKSLISLRGVAGKVNG